MEKNLNLMFKMMNLLFRESQNFIISPMGIEVLAYTLMSGSSGKCFEEFSRTLLGIEIKPEDVNDVMRVYKQVVARLQQVEMADVVFNNFVFLEQKYDITQKFQEYVHICLDTKVKTLDFTADPIENFNQITKEVREVTKDKVLNPLRNIPTISKMMLVNCTCIVAPPKYEPHSIYVGKFNLSAKGENVEVQFTIQRGQFKYSSNAEFDYLEMPYMNDMLSLCIIQPNNGQDVRNVLQNLKTHQLNQLFNSSSEVNMDLHMPHIRLQTNMDLAHQLQMAGFQKAFDDEADFSRMSRNWRGLKVESLVSHLDFSIMDITKLTLPVNQDAKLEHSKPGVAMVLNTPFIYMVKCAKKPDERMILLSGAVNNIEYQ